MGRPATYTDEQDALILTIQEADVLNARFAELGYGTRSPNALARRRAYLKSVGEDAALSTEAEKQLPKLLQRRRAIDAELTKVINRQMQLHEERDDVNKTITRLMEELQDGLSESASAV